MGKPNLFDYATSELSQDAFLCWLMAWANQDQIQNDKLLNKCACNFIRELLGISSGYKIETIKIRRQWNKIDVCALVNDEYFIVIEDKKGTKEHSNQLERYKKIAKKEYNTSNRKVKCVYFKMQGQSDYTNIKDAGFSVFKREKMISILEKYISESKKTNNINHILNDYYENLVNLDNAINSYKELQLDDWKWYAWQGFYSELQKELGDGQWSYVANKSGGFLGFWWHWKNSKYKGNYFEFYLQIEQDKLIFKLYSENPKVRKEIRAYYRSVLYELANDMGIEVKQYGRIGTWMGVARLSETYRKTNSDNRIDMKATIKTLKDMQTLLDKVYAELSK